MYIYVEGRNMRVSIFKCEGREDSKILRIKRDSLVHLYIFKRLNMRSIVRYNKWESMSFDKYGDSGDSKIYNSLRIGI